MICAIVLAAGCSSRMGVQKLLLPFGQATVISHIVGQVTTSMVKKTYVVVGHQAQEVTRELAGNTVSIINNKEYTSGMLASFRAGLRHISRQFNGILVVLGDQPTITSAIIDEMILASRGTEKKIVVPVYNGRRGHPIIISTEYRDAILSNYDDVGLRGVLQEHKDDVFEVNVSNPAVCADMDYPADYQRRIDEYNCREGPTPYPPSGRIGRENGIGRSL
jgi:molybdenum cofactor cytidylyltransferase